MDLCGQSGFKNTMARGWEVEWAGRVPVSRFAYQPLGLFGKRIIKLPQRFKRLWETGGLGSFVQQGNPGGMFAEPAKCHGQSGLKYTHKGTLSRKDRKHSIEW